MRIRRRSLRKLLVIVGCVVGIVSFRGALAGGLLLLVGSGLHLWSRGCLEQNHRLTTAGPYRWTRNPFYLANLLIDVGLCFVIGSGWVAALFLPVWWLSYRETISREEIRLLALFPDEFQAYLDSVPRLIPSGRGLSLDRAEGRFDWQNPALSQGSEYARLLSLWLSFGTIWAGELLRREQLAILDERNAWAFGLVVILLCGWVVKLALAETFRRPQTPLLPFASQPALRHGVTVLLLSAAIFSGSMRALALPGLWCVLLALDRLGESRLGRRGQVKQRAWRYFLPIAIGSNASLALIEVMARPAGG
jgi:hypothetical protein